MVMSAGREQVPLRLISVPITAMPDTRPTLWTPSVPYRLTRSQIGKDPYPHSTLSPIQVHRYTESKHCYQCFYILHILSDGATNSYSKRLSFQHTKKNSDDERTKISACQAIMRWTGFWHDGMGPDTLALEARRLQSLESQDFYHTS